MYSIHRIVWDLSLSVVIVCILWMAFFSGRLNWVYHFDQVRLQGGKILPVFANYLSCNIEKMHRT